jgi:ABC-type sugar transport system ATPase subunit
LERGSFARVDIHATTTPPKVLIADEPTRGIDVGALRSLARQGRAIIVVSSELPEILSLSNRILVMRGGRIVANLATEQASEEIVGGLAVGLSSPEPANVGH